jgi:hypothetical protein
MQQTVLEAVDPTVNLQFLIGFPSVSDDERVREISHLLAYIQLTKPIFTVIHFG